jgi:hypothetical protein
VQVEVNNGIHVETPLVIRKQRTEGGPASGPASGPTSGPTSGPASEGGAQVRTPHEKETKWTQKFLKYTQDYTIQAHLYSRLVI